MLRFYAYKGCDSCRKARKWLQANNQTFEEIAIREQPPSIPELELALEILGNIRLLFNTSGVDYRQMGMKDQLPQLSDAEALTYLAETGNLVKRPFLIDTETKRCLTGFKEDVWADTLSS